MDNKGNIALEKVLPTLPSLPYDPKDDVARKAFEEEHRKMYNKAWTQSLPFLPGTTLHAPDDKNYLLPPLTLE